MIASSGKFVLVLNAGSSSLKFELFDLELKSRLDGVVSDIGESSPSLKTGNDMRKGDFPSHQSAIAAVLSSMSNFGFAAEDLAAVGHRVVHGGDTLTAPAVVTDDVLKLIRDCESLAPLHNKHNRAGIEAIKALKPDLLQVACFDTAFHATNPRVATAFALPSSYEARGMRRYGFHGSSYEAIVENLPKLTNQPLPKRLLALHLGNGASVCAIHEGKSIATSMGYSPLDGLTMGTRSGTIDGSLVLRLATERGISKTEELLNKGSGLLGLSGKTSNMAELIDRYYDDELCRFAVDHFCYWSVRHSASMIGAMEGLDAMVFSGGIGERGALIRDKIVTGFRWLRAKINENNNNANLTKLHADDSEIGVWIVPAEEEKQIARHTMKYI